MKKALMALIRFYRKYISPMKRPCCRFSPTCSSYALEAVEKHGALRGGYLAIRRILKCHPFHEGGYDPVPDNIRSSRLGHKRLHYKNQY